MTAGDSPTPEVPSKPKRKRIKKGAAETSAVAQPPSTPGTETAPAKTPERERLNGFVRKAVRLFISWIVLLAVAALLDFACEEFNRAKPEIVKTNTAVLRTLRNMQPLDVAAAFYNRLLQRHGFAHYQWSEPFNAEFQLINLTKALEAKYGELTVVEDPKWALTHEDATYYGNDDAKTYVIPKWAVISDDPLMHLKSIATFSAPSSAAGYGSEATPSLARSPIIGIVRKKIPSITDPGEMFPEYAIPDNSRQWSAKETADAIAFAATYTRVARHIKKYALPGRGSPDFSGWIALINALIALPDAYLTLVQHAFPRGSLPVQLTLVILVLLSLQVLLNRLTEDKDVDPMAPIAVILILPLFVSTIAFILLHAALWAAGLFGKWLVAPAFTVTAAAGVAPFLSWATGIITEHHTSESGIKLALKYLLKEAEESESHRPGLG